MSHLEIYPFFFCLSQSTELFCFKFNRTLIKNLKLNKNKVLAIKLALRFKKILRNNVKNQNFITQFGENFFSL